MCAQREAQGNGADAQHNVDGVQGELGVDPGLDGVGDVLRDVGLLVGRREEGLLLELLLLVLGEVLLLLLLLILRIRLERLAVLLKVGRLALLRRLVRGRKGWCSRW